MSIARGRAVVLFLCLILHFSEDVTSVGIGELHPCRPQRSSVKTGGSFVVGFAFVANGNNSSVEWSSPEHGPHPCVEADRETLMPHTISVSYFNVEVDKLTLLDSVHQLQEILTEDFNNITVVGFSGGYRSEARVVSVRDGKNWKIIRSLALIADFSEKGLKQLQWFDLECGECDRMDECVRFDQQTSCASSCDLSERETCKTEIYISFDGIDRNKEVLNSATQIRRLRRASMSQIYASGRDIATNAVPF